MSKYKNEIGINPKITIGIEIEAEGKDSEKLKKEKKLKPNKDTEIEWTTTDDGSLHDGVEVVSPIITDNEEAIKEIYAICYFMQEHNFQTSYRCGGHIHIGANHLTTKKSYENLLELWGNLERAIYLMANKAGETPREIAKMQAKPISILIEKNSKELFSSKDQGEFIVKLQDIFKYEKPFGNEKRYGVNFSNINNQDKNTIEFRVANGTIDPDVWIQNIKLFGRMVQRSEQLAIIEGKEEKTEEEERLLKLKNTFDSMTTEEDKVRIFLELLLDAEDIEVFLNRYEINKKKAENEKSDFYDNYLYANKVKFTQSIKGEEQYGEYR